MHYRKDKDGFRVLPDVRTMRKDGSWVDKQGKTHPATDVPKAGKLPNYNKPESQGPKMGNDGTPNKPVEIWLNQMLGPGIVDLSTGKVRPKTIKDDINAAKAACEDAGRTLSAAEQAELNKCRNTDELKAYLNSIGVTVRFSYWTIA